MNDFNPKIIKEFYNSSYCSKLLGDYVYGNERAEAAIRLALKWIPGNARKILDIGCGIGWSTHEFKRCFTKASIVGVDISREEIQAARQLFQKQGLSYSVRDIARDNEPSYVSVDSIVMIDVYEHIPSGLRKNIHRYIASSLNPGGRLILTFPSTSKQESLRKSFPDKLQPVDENVSSDDIHNLATEINGKVIIFEHVTIWEKDDYVHVVIEREQKDDKKVKSNNKKLFWLEKKNHRAKRVLERLKIRAMRDGNTALPNRGDLSICVIHPNFSVCDKNVETFIRAHIEQLPSKIRVLYGSSYPQFKDNGERLLVLPFWPKLKRVIAKRVLKLSEETLRNEAFKRFIKQNNIQAVLAEYGPTGAAICEACKMADVPLIVHFHGYDASEHKTLERFKDEYKKMFQNAAAIIAVSNDMKEQLINLGAPEQKISLNVYGIDTSLFYGAEPAHAPPIFVAVGRFTEKKAPQLTIRAFFKVVQSCVDAKLVMIGEGDLWEDCKQLSSSLGLNGAVDFLGKCPPEKIAETMRHARAFVQHSLRPDSGDSEGTPVAILEAGASGLPVVARRHAGIKDVVVDGQTGFLVDERDVEGMSQRMLQLCEEPVLAGKLGKAARERVRTNYNMDLSINTLYKIIQDNIHG